jgi:DNA mismatch repair ATPase MutL
MFGDTLNEPEMKKIVNNLSTLIQPFNCPHGRYTFPFFIKRPVMRHLLSMNSLIENMNLE